jgi:hypothetical protein
VLSRDIADRHRVDQLGAAAWEKVTASELGTRRSPG